MKLWIAYVCLPNMKKQITNVVASTNENNKIFEAYQINRKQKSMSITQWVKIIDKKWLGYLFYWLCWPQSSKDENGKETCTHVLVRCTTLSEKVARLCGENMIFMMIFRSKINWIKCWLMFTSVDFSPVELHVEISESLDWLLVDTFNENYFSF